MTETRTFIVDGQKVKMPILSADDRPPPKTGNIEFPDVDIKKVSPGASKALPLHRIHHQENPEIERTAKLVEELEQTIEGVLNKEENPWIFALNNYSTAILNSWDDAETVFFAKVILREYFSHGPGAEFSEGQVYPGWQDELEEG